MTIGTFVISPALAQFMTMSLLTNIVSGLMVAMCVGLFRALLLNKSSAFA